MLAPLLFAMFAAANPPTLCVSLHAEPNIKLDELLAAMRARIARKDVRVVACEKAKREEITWRLEVLVDTGNAVALSLRGREVDAQRTVPVRDMSSTEIVQTISLTAVEAVRQSLDKLLVEMGVSAEPETNLVEEIEKAACPEATPCKEPEVIVRNIEVFRPDVWELGTSIGPMLGIDPDGASPLASFYGEVAPAVWVGRFGFALHAGVNILPRRRAAGASLQVSEVELGARVYTHVSGPVRVGIGAQSRLATARASSGSPFFQNGAQFFWSGGFELSAAIDLLRRDQFALGADVHMWLWPQPNRFLFQGEALVRQGHVEVFFGPTLRYFFKD